MKKLEKEFPLQINIGFKKVFDAYRNNLNEQGADVAQIEEMLKMEREYPILSSGISDVSKLNKYSTQIDGLLNPMFPTVLESNEIKFATVPFQDFVIKSSKRYKDIVKTAGDDFELDLINFDEDKYYIMGCSLILYYYYDYAVDFQRAFYYNIPDARGMVKNYRVAYNADFVEVEKTKDAPEITQEDVNELLESFEDIAVWKKKFPPNSWIFKGFVIASLFDVTRDVSISDFKTNLLRLELSSSFQRTEFERIFRAIFDLKDLIVGFSDYNEESESFERVLFKEVKSFILDNKKSELCNEALCSASYYTLFKQNEFYVVTDTERYHKKYPDNLLYKKLLDQNVKSAIFAAIVSDGKILGVIELVSPNANDLNTINANKLRDLIPSLIDSVLRSKENLENELELIVQEECTAIHNSVHWKFRKEAKRYLNGIAEGNPTFFREIVFEDVFPLYGQTDIKGSSEARNIATQKDLILQLEYISDVIKKLEAHNSLPIFEQIGFLIDNYILEIGENLQVDTERKIFNFLTSEIVPLFKHLKKKNEFFKETVQEYYKIIDTNTGLVYKHRKDYDESVMFINKRLASVLDKKQKEAQQMFPHFFERFKTDGVEHNMYIGEAITKEKSFNKIYLKNLKLWQLQVVCEMENTYYRHKDKLPVDLEVASMILAFNGSLSLRFRMDEKRFDVDGTYNARYEVVKKRVDKATIKGSEERITQPGKIAIVYSQEEDEQEYLKYIEFLHHKKMLQNDVEICELEDLQGVTGLKALRVSVLYSTGNKDSSKEFYTYEDLVSQLND